MLELVGKKIWALLDKSGHPDNWKLELCNVDTVCLKTGWIKLSYWTGGIISPRTKVTGWYPLSEFDCLAPASKEEAADYGK